MFSDYRQSDTLGDWYLPTSAEFYNIGKMAESLKLPVTHMHIMEAEECHVHTHT